MDNLPDKKLRYSCILLCWHDWLVGIAVNHGLYLTNKIGISLIIGPICVASELPYRRNHHLTHLNFFESSAMFQDRHSKNTDIFVLKLPVWMTVFLKKWITPLYCFPHQQSRTDSNFSIGHNRQNLNKQRECLKWIVHPSEPVYIHTHAYV